MIKWNEVTWYSKLLSVIFFFIVFPILLVVIAHRYKQVIGTYTETRETLQNSVQQISQSIQNASSTMSTASTTPQE